MEQQPNSQRTELIATGVATGARILGPLVVQVLEAHNPKVGGFARQGLKAYIAYMDKQESEETSHSVYEESKGNVANGALTSNGNGVSKR